MVATLVKERKKKMTNVEFQKKLVELYALHPIINKSERKTFNELLYVLRKDYSVTDYNINTFYGDEMSCITSAKECFVPVRDLARHVSKVEYDEFFNDAEFGYDGICLTVWLED